MKNNEDRVIDQFRHRLAGLLILKHTLAALTVWEFLAGSMVLVLRSLGVSSLALLWGLVTVLFAFVPAIFLAYRRMPSQAALRAVVDQRSLCGGLLMAGAEVELGAWKQVMPKLHLPRLQWRSGRAWGLLAAGGVFIMVGLLLPQSFAEMGNGPSLNIEKQKAKLDKQIDVLKEEAVLEPRKADDLKSKLEQIRHEALGKEPVKTLDALDHLKDMVSQSAKEAAESDARKNETMGQAEALANALQTKSKEMSAKVMAEAMKQLAALARKAATENKLVQQGLELNPELLEALKAGTLTPEQLDKLKDLLKDAKGELSKQLAQLGKVELIDADLIDRCDKAGRCDSDALVAYLKKAGVSDESIKDISDNKDANGATAAPGNGETGGSICKDPTTEDGYKFKEIVLPPAHLQALKKSKLKGVSVTAPQKSSSTSPTESGALAGSSSGGGSASTRIVLPRHRGAVERYFKRNSH